MRAPMVQGPDAEERCPICEKDLVPDSVASVSLVMWVPATSKNVLIQMACGTDHLNTWLTEEII